MIQTNNALADIFGYSEVNSNRIGVYVFKGTMPTKDELNAILDTDAHITQGNIYKALMEKEGTDIEILSELHTERNYKTGYVSRETMMSSISSDPAEMQVVTSGTPTFFMFAAMDASFNDAYMPFNTWPNKTSYDINLIAFGTVGDEGSGADMILKGGLIVDGNTYKINDMIMQVLEP